MNYLPKSISFSSPWSFFLRSFSSFLPLYEWMHEKKYMKNVADLVKHTTKIKSTIKAWNKCAKWNTHSWILFCSSSKIGPLKSLMIKYVIHSRSTNFSIPVSDVSTGTPKLWAKAMVSGSFATAPIKHIRFFDDTSAIKVLKKNYENFGWNMSKLSYLWWDQKSGTNLKKRRIQKINKNHITSGRATRPINFILLSSLKLIFHKQIVISMLTL